MSAMRRFLVAPSLARLVVRESPATAIVEGHFPASDGRLGYLLCEDSCCQLVLLTKSSSASEEEERTELLPAQGAFLLEVCAGVLAYQRCRLEVGGLEINLNRFERPENLNIIEVETRAAGQQRLFKPAVWFGPEVTDDPAYEHNAVAVQGVPRLPEIPLSTAALDAVVDLLDMSREARSHPQPWTGTIEPFPFGPAREARSVISSGNELRSSPAGTAALRGSTLTGMAAEQR